MVTVQNHLGKITFSKQFFASLIGGTVTNCFGVVGMNAGSTKQSLLEKIPLFKDKSYIDKALLFAM